MKITMLSSLHILSDLILRKTLWSDYCCSHSADEEITGFKGLNILNKF